MTDNVRYLSDLELHGNMTFAAPVTDFPSNPKIGTFILKGTDLYAYLKIGDLETWFPFASGTNSFVQTQGVAAQNWTVTHNLGTTNVWFQVKDENGVIQNVGKTDVNSNTFTVNFTCPMKGTVVVVAPDSINVPEVKAEVIRLGTNVVIDTSGVTIGGNAVLTSASIATVATSGSYNDLIDKPSVPNSSIVVNTPSVSGNTSAAIGYDYTLSFSATSALSGGSISSFTITKPDNTTQTVAASNNAGTLVWAATGTGEQVKTFTVVANDNLGNKSATATLSATLFNVVVNVPSITSPSANAIGIQNTFTMSTGTFGLTPATGFTDTHQYTDWEIWTGANRSGTLVWSSTNDATNKTTITVPNTSGLAVSTTYYIAVRHKGTTNGWGGYAHSTFTTASQFVPTVAGTAYEGGFYAGRLKYPDDKIYAIIVPTKSTQTTATWGGYGVTTGGTNAYDGWANCQILSPSGGNGTDGQSHPAAAYCRGLTSGGKTDWTLPAQAELEVCYRVFKPDSTANNTGSGTNSYSVDSNGVANGSIYTAIVPGQTAATAFMTGGTECFDTASYLYWASTESNNGYAWGQNFGDGRQFLSSKYSTRSVRAVRKVLI